MLLGESLSTSNFSSAGFSQGIGYFDGTQTNIGFDEGIILSTGGLDLVTEGMGEGSGLSGDADLELALNQINLNWDVNNVTVLEFDFVAISDYMAFSYIFGSTEYTSYTCTQYNDIFGFFLSGPGINGIYSNNAVNIALVPDPDNPGQFTNTPVAVNTLNSGTPSEGADASVCDDIDGNWTDYNVFWVDNEFDAGLQNWEGVNPPFEPQFTVEGLTGFTVPLTAQYNGLIYGETYHIKLAIADASDFSLNSVVFLEGTSFVNTYMGCMEEMACNYNPNALEDDGSCDYCCYCEGPDTVYITETVIEYQDVIITEYLDCETGAPCESGIAEIIEKSKTDGRIYNIHGQEINKREGIYIEEGEIKYRLK